MVEKLPLNNEVNYIFVTRDGESVSHFHNELVHGIDFDLNKPAPELKINESNNPATFCPGLHIYINRLMKMRCRKLPSETGHLDIAAHAPVLSRNILK